MANTTTELIWIKSLLKELGIFQEHASVLWFDNVGATYLTSNPIFHARTKHVELDFHFVCERVSQHTFDVWFISSKDRVADVLTKLLMSTRFAFLCSKLHVEPHPFSLRVHVKEIELYVNLDETKTQTHKDEDKKIRLG